MTYLYFNIYSMNYLVDRSLVGDGILQYTTESGTKFLAKIFKTSAGSDLWSLDFVKVSGTPSPVEVFKTMKTLTDAAMEYAVQREINRVIIFIAGETQQIIEKKTAAFQRWLVVDWDFEIMPYMDVRVLGLRTGFTVPTNTLLLTRKKLLFQRQILQDDRRTIKFCFNCGQENKEFLYCPTCGTKL